MSEPVHFGKALARFAAGWRSAEIPDEVGLKTRLHLIDTLAAIVSGSALEAGLAGQRYAGGVGGREAASILGTRLRAPLVEAALANGMAAHADESDDSHETSQTHPGCGVVPAALAVAEDVGATGADFLRAIHLGYEITIRFGEAMAPAMSFARSSLSCHAWGPLFGAGFASGYLMSFDESRYLVLLNYLAQEASGLTTWRLDDAHTLKSYVFAGMPASNGAKAAALVRAGFTGAGDVLDPRDRNFFDAVSKEMKPDLLYRDLGKAFRIMETDFKKYSVGFPIAAPVAALEEIVARAALRPDEIAAVRVRYLDDWYRVIGDENRMPDLSLRYCMAATMLDGKLTFAASHDEGRMNAPDILSLARRIAFLPAEAGQDRFEARLEVDARGRTFEARQGLHVLGRKENPMSVEQVHAKAAELLEMVLTPAQAREVIAIAHGLEEEPGVAQLVAATIPGVAGP